MGKQTEFDQKLERLLSASLRAIPARRAPRSLESRILGELQRRAALPWWRRGFSDWPLPARATFLALCAALVGATFLDGVSAALGAHSITDLAAGALLWMRPLLALVSSGGGVLSSLAHVIPAAWIYAGLAAGTLLYVALFGLGATAYRTLYIRPSMAGSSL
jgi:hypothetical protein